MKTSKKVKKKAIQVNFLSSDGLSEKLTQKLSKLTLTQWGS